MGCSAAEATGQALFVLLLSTLVCCQPTELIWAFCFINFPLIPPSLSFHHRPALSRLGPRAALNGPQVAPLLHWGSRPPYLRNCGWEYISTCWGFWEQITLLTQQHNKSYQMICPPHPLSSTCSYFLSDGRQPRQLDGYWWVWRVWILAAEWRDLHVYPITTADDIIQRLGWNR